MNRRDFLKTAVSCVAASGMPVLLCRASAAGSDRKPNIVVILADDLGYAELGVQSCKDIPTPNIDSIAMNGVRFTDGYVTHPVCAPTRAGLLTGRYQQRFGFEHNPGPEQQASPDFGLPRDETTLAERLKAAGYTTGMVGKWHVGYKPELQPPERGFDSFYGFLSGAHSYLPASRRGSEMLRGTTPVQFTGYLTDEFAREAVAFIDRSKDKPFFLYLAFNAVHSPLEAIQKYLDRFGSITDEKRRTFAAMTSAMDDAVGAVLTKLRDAKLEEDTLVFFLSDNGGPTPQTTSRNDPLRGYKGQVFEGGIRIPFLVQWPRHIPSGVVYRQPVVSLDIHATALAAADVSAPTDKPLDGVNLLPYLTGENTGRPHEGLFWRAGEQHAARVGDWKLVQAPGQASMLFDLAKDIGEQNDLAAREPAKLKEVQAVYDNWDKQMVPAKWRRSEVAEATSATPPRGQRAGTLRQRLESLDRNGDGKLSRDELPHPEVFERLDANRDGFVTLDEARSGWGRR